MVSRLSRLWDKVQDSAKGLLAVLIAIAVVIILWGQSDNHGLLQRSLVASNIHHQQTAAQNARIEQLTMTVKDQQAQIIDLLNQHSLNFAQEVQEFVYVNGTLACVANHTPCPAPPAFLSGK